MADAEAGRERIDQLRLIRTPRIGHGSATCNRSAVFGSAGEAIRARPDLARRGGGDAPAIHDRGLAERELAQVARLSARHLMLGGRDYPALLSPLDDAPPVFTVRGDLALAQRPYGLRG